MERTVVSFALALALLWSAQAAAQVTDRVAQEPARKPEVVNRVRAGEPMPGQMKRKGMKKEAVHEHAMKKDALMREAMKREAPPKK